MRVDPTRGLILAALPAEYLSTGRLGVPRTSFVIPDHAPPLADDPHAASRKDQH